MIFSVNVLYDRFSLQKYYKMLYMLRLGGTFSLGFCDKREFVEFHLYPVMS